MFDHSPCTPKLDNASTYGAAFVAGVFLHIAVFRVGEWNLYTPHILSTTIILNGLGAYCIATFLPEQATSFLHAFKLSSLLLGACVAGIYSSIIVYRAAFHRLNRFPGPFAARLSNLYVTSLSVKQNKLYEEIQELHQKYGDIVRVGPTELSIADPAVFTTIHSNHSPVTKGPWYDLLHPEHSLHMLRDHKEHARRRKIWEKGLSSKALRDYEPRIAEHTRTLLNKVEETQGKPLNVAQWFNFYSFDVMGDLAFSKSFNMLRDGVIHYIMGTVHTNMDAVGIFGHLVWVFPLLKAVPLLNADHLKFQKWRNEQVTDRRRRAKESTDLYSWILAEYEAIPNPTAQETLNVHGDCDLIVVAGSDTTAISLTCLFFQLANNPAVAEKLRAEIDQYYGEHGKSDSALLSKLEYLQGCINETLRLHPPVPSGVQRMTPPEGLQLGETFLPGNTIIQTPTHTLHRDPRVFLQPNEFIPERWTSRPELVKDAAIFSPFSSGRYSCVGKQMGLMELRYVTSQIIHRFDVQLAPGQTEEKFQRELRDSFTLGLRTMDLVFTARKG